MGKIFDAVKTTGKVMLMGTAAGLGTDAIVSKVQDSIDKRNKRKEQEAVERVINDFRWTMDNENHFNFWNKNLGQLHYDIYLNGYNPMGSNLSSYQLKELARSFLIASKKKQKMEKEERQYETEADCFVEIEDV